jgi:2,3-bisphosphoglycerate-independent phosphoglycerate mutase
LLSTIKLNDVEIEVAAVREHRFVVLFQGQGLSAELGDSDPQQVGLEPKPIIPLSTEAIMTALSVNEFIARAGELLADSQPANMVLLRGFSKRPTLPTLEELYKLNPAAIATYPMYRGLAKLMGMDILETGGSISDELDTLSQYYDDYDFFYVHIKQTDSAGEDGDFEGKVRVIEEVDALLPRLTSLEPDVLIVTADHSTPAVLKGHSWHPVPFLLRSKWCLPDDVPEFSERACAAGALGRFPATQVMPLALAHALRLEKFGA